MPHRIWIIISLLALVSLLPSLSAQESPTPQALPSESGVILGGVVYEADFELDPLWEAGGYADNTFAWQPSRQGLTLVSTDDKSPARHTNGTSFIGQDFYAELSFIPVQCLSDESALLFNTRSDSRAESPSTAEAYVFVIQCDGMFRSRVVEEGGASGFIDFDGVLAHPLNLKQEYHLGLLMQGRRVTWYLDGELLGEYLISQAARPGELAPGAQLGLTVIISDLIVWELP
jgi:hypothetical protein